MTARELLSSAAEELARAGCPSPLVDAEWLLAQVLGVTRTDLYGDGNRPFEPEKERRFRELVARRARREPLAYVIGEWGFRGLRLQVDARVLVPRPETEAVVGRCLALLAGLDEPRVLDVGVGSCAIALAIAEEHPSAFVVATDNSPGALAVAAENRARAGLAERVELVQGELLAGQDGPFELIVANPPYIEPDELDGLEPEVAQYEPRQALVASGATEVIADEARSRLTPDGALVLETGDGKAGAVADLFRRLGYEEVSIGQDLTGRDRIVDGRAPR